MTGFLSEHDVQRLMADPSPTSRAMLAAKVGAELTAERLTESERALAVDIVRVMTRDAEVLVRHALAEAVKAAPGLPHDVALRLAQDVEQVALPVIEVSRVLTDDDLITLVRSAEGAKLQAVARRGSVSGAVADALVEKGDEAAVAALVANSGASLTQANLERVVDRFGDRPQVQRPLVQRRNLPITVAERLVALVSEELRGFLAAQAALPMTVADDLVLRSRERATHTLVTDAVEDVDVERLVRQLASAGRLTPSLLLRALCLSDMRFFESGLAVLAGIPLAAAVMLIDDKGPLGLRSLWEKGRLPMALLPPVRVALRMVNETDYDGEPGDIERHRRRVLERVLTQLEDMRSDDIAYLLDRLSDLSRTAA